jgi:UDP-N-acetylglucosamine--N-acetylmuramyl-(pentapeptide) pyrophosphoryl-undecaprenol N-acetylglucosamine transferase
MRIWVSGGGTAGHVYPALAAIEAGGAEVADVLWLGTAAGMEGAMVRRHGVRFRALDAGPIVGVSPVRLVANGGRILHGALQAWRLMGRERPDAVLVTGGYVSVPVAVAARLRSVPLVVFLPDVVPGRAVRLMAAMARRVAVSTARSLAYFPGGRALETGYPVRPEIRAADRRASRARLGLSPFGRVLLAFGGSRGARTINNAVLASIPCLVDRAEVLHVTGRLDFDAVERARAQMAPATTKRYHAYAYLEADDMAAALAACDLVVSRAGAAVLAEYAARGLPAILVPLAIAGGHQAANAAALVDAGAAVAVADANLTPEALTAAVTGLLADPAKLEAMASASRALDRPDAARAVWQVTEQAALASHSAADGSRP